MKKKHVENEIRNSDKDLLRNLELAKDAEQFFIFCKVCVRRQLEWQDLFLDSSLDPSLPELYFDALREAECPSVELKSIFMFAEESCQFGASYNRKRHRMLSYHISSTW